MSSKIQSGAIARSDLKVINKILNWTQLFSCNIGSDQYKARLYWTWGESSVKL